MTCRPQVRPRRILLVFVLWVSLLLAAGDRWVPVYTESLIPLVNAALGAEGLPVSVALRGEILSLRNAAGRHYALRLLEDAVLVATVLSAVALFLAGPGPWRRRLAWGGATLALLWLTHGVSLYAGVYAALGDMMAALPQELREPVLHGSWQSFRPARVALFRELAGVWPAYGGPGLVLLGWLQVLPGPGGPDASRFTPPRSGRHRP